MKGGLCTKFALAGLGLSSFSSFCKKVKQTDQCDVCGLEKKKRRPKMKPLYVTKLSPTKGKVYSKRSISGNFAKYDPLKTLE